MTKRWGFIVSAFVLAALLWWLYQDTKLPPGVESKGPENWLPWVSLTTSLVSLVTGLVTLALKLIELRQKA